MKKYIIILGLVAITLNSCNEETVELTPIGGTEAGFFQNEAEMNQAILGAYQKLTFFQQYDNGNYLQKTDLLPSDDITVIGNSSFENFNGLNGDNTEVKNIYKFAYQLIARTNIVLDKIEENGSFVYADNPSVGDWHKGEALFLKSLINFKLWNTFGTAPLVTERITDLANAYPPNSSGTELLDQAITDLTVAVDLLPDTWSSDFLGRATKNSAKGLLIKILVFRGTVKSDNTDFGTAVTIFNTITDRTLTPNYDDNFNYEKENNSESMFEYQANGNVNNFANTWLGGAGGNDAFAVVGEINSYYNYFNGGFFGGDPKFTATPSLMATYEAGDPRLSLIYDTSSGANNFIKYITNDVPFFQKLSANNERILRYADVMLLAAEAMVRSGGSVDDAIGLVNQIRTRARNSSDPVSAIPADLIAPATAADALAMVLTERRMELAGEGGHRWHDLRRFSLAGEIDLSTLDFGSVNTDFSFQAHHINFPLPNREVIDNPNMNQNSGY